jgi:hypothetical protein
MAKRRRTDRGTAAKLDQVLLELFAGQLLLEPAEAKLPGERAVRPVTAYGRRKGQAEEPPAGNKAEEGVRARARAAANRAKKLPGGEPPGSSKDQGG